MLSDSKKISIRQAFFLFLTIVFSPATRLFPVYAAQNAKEAAWLAPIVSAILLFLLVLVWNRINKSYTDASLIHIYSDILGVFTGKLIGFTYLLWVTMLAALYVRYFAIRLVGSIYPDTSQNVFVISIIILAIYILRYGLVTLARLNEIVLPLFLVTLVILFIMITPYLKGTFLIPITYRSILPITRAGVGIAAVFSYFTFVFILGDNINNKENIKKEGIKCSFLLTASTILIIVMTVGTFSYSVIRRSQLPLLIAVKQISLFNTLEKIESIVVAVWVFSDFILISFFILLGLRIIKLLFGISDEKPFMGIYAIIVYFLAFYIANTVFELENLSSFIMIPGNLFLGFVVPVLVFFIGRIRGKV